MTHTKSLSSLCLSFSLQSAILCDAIYEIHVFTGPEGMEKFCEDLGVDPENVVMLVIAYKMGAKQMGFFSQEEWLKGTILSPGFLCTTNNNKFPILVSYEFSCCRFNRTTMR